MRDVTLVILNSLRIKCHIRRHLTATYANNESNLRNATLNSLSRFIYSVNSLRH